MTEVLVNSPTELTTGATDAVLAIECLWLICWVRQWRDRDPWKTDLWCGVLGLVAFAAGLGTVAHLVAWSPAAQVRVWRPIYLSLGILVALFATGAIYDAWGREKTRRLLPWSIGVGVAFWGLTEVISGGFRIFVVYEAVAMTGSLVIYLRLAATGRLAGAGVMALAVLLNLAAAGVQASEAALRIPVPLDHNGLFHLVQILAMAVVGWGVALGLQGTDQLSVEHANQET